MCFWGNAMSRRKATVSFRKTVDCPSANTLLSFTSRKLSGEIETLVGYHLLNCDFCNSELELLSHCGVVRKEIARPPEIPMNLRILAESLLCQGSKLRNIH
jgi:hypothetical protein